MILRDPVHGLISFEGRAETLIERLLRSAEVQRLRRVRQLGMAATVFPGAEHSRFAHALGAAHVFVLLAARIRACQGDLRQDLRMNETDEADALAAALLHDLGHGPLSHLFEEVMPHARPHEEWTVATIVDRQTDVNRALRSFDERMPERVASLVSGEHRLPYLARAISGTLDVDRCDYLLRDSHMTGVRYGLFDLDWLLRSLTFTEVGKARTPALAIEGRKGLPPIENFFLARHFMYQQVYHHKATRAAESLIRGMFRRVAELIREGSPPSPVPAAVRASVLGDAASLGDYLELDDHRLLSCFADWEKGGDRVLADMANRLRVRRLPKTIPLPDGAEEAVRRQEAFDRACEIARRHGLREDLSVWLDVTCDIPYVEPAGDNPDGLWVVLRHRPPTRLGDVSFVLGELRNKRIDRSRLIFPPEIRDEVCRAVERILQ